MIDYIFWKITTKLNNNNRGILISSDVIMDILGNSRMRQIITEYYQASDEPRYVRQAINAVAVSETKQSGTFARNLTRHFSYAMYGARK